MNSTAELLENILVTYSEKLQKLSEEEYANKPRADKWSKKEALGHLADSAQNNLRRFIVSQYEDVPHIVYHQDKWVAINNYQQASTKEILNIWLLLNKQICSVLKNTSIEIQQRRCATNLSEPQTIEFLANDYVKHLQHHLHQILDMEPIDYP